MRSYGLAQDKVIAEDWGHENTDDQQRELPGRACASFDRSCPVLRSLWGISDCPRVRHRLLV